jgi:hypothetical protein
MVVNQINDPKVLPIGHWEKVKSHTYIFFGICYRFFNSRYYKLEDPCSIGRWWEWGERVVEHALVQSFLYSGA